MTQWIQEGDGQPIRDGDYVPILRGHIHFIRASFNTGRFYPGFSVAPETRCGVPVPEDEYDRSPIMGEVDCSTCLLLAALDRCGDEVEGAVFA